MNIFKIHPLYYLFLVIVILTGNFNNYMLFTFIILFHELGHILASFLFKWKIEKIVILPFGCVTIFNKLLNTKIIEDIIVTISGPLFQIILSLFLEDKSISNSILLFNLLPIFPLDGAKILNSIQDILLPYKKSYTIMLYISFITSIIAIIYLKNNLILIMSILLLIYRCLIEYKNIKYTFNKFIFERTYYDLKFKKRKIVENKDEFRKDHYHLVKENGLYITEKDYLRLCK